jgi:hypothetical protein
MEPLAPERIGNGSSPSALGLLVPAGDENANVRVNYKREEDGDITFSYPGGGPAIAQTSREPLKACVLRFLYCSRSFCPSGLIPAIFSLNSVALISKKTLIFNFYRNSGLNLGFHRVSLV